MSNQRLAVLALTALVALATRASSQDVPWRLGTWNPDSLGNQRVMLHVADTGTRDAVRALIAWRRSDTRPELKRIIVTDNRGVRIANVVAVRISRDSGDLVFEPTRGAGDYYIYYLPYAGSVRSNYPRITYPRPDSTASPLWLVSARANTFALPPATVVAFEAVDSLSQRWPMEVVATESETRAVRSLARGRQPFLVFVEDRANPIKMRDDLPVTWATRAAGLRPLGPAQRDEYYAFQLGVWGLTGKSSVHVRFSSFNAPRNAMIKATAFDCITTDGADWKGRPFHRDANVEPAMVTPIWCGVMVPRDAAPGTYAGTATVSTASGEPVAVPLEFSVGAEVAVNHGDDEPWRLSRLRWLNSQLAADGKPIPPYTPVRAIPGGFAILGRSLQLDAVGLPRQIASSFGVDLTLTSVSHPMLVRPFTFEVEGADGKTGMWRGSGTRTVRATGSRAEFAATGHQGALDLAVRGTLEFDGNLEYQVALVARRDTTVRDIRLVMIANGWSARYFMGMNRPGGAADDRAHAKYHWQWNVASRNQDAFWLGNINGGFQVTLKDESYARPLNTNFYLQSPLKLPRSWGNDGTGRCDFDPGEHASTMTCGSGPRTLVANDTLWFNFRVLVTPFHSIDTKTHFSTRYMHAYKPVDTARAVGANLVNVHHATAINPFINYPFLRPAAMKAYADSLHEAGMRFKIYYTVRELTNHAPEIWALRSLGTEVLADGPGGGHSWLQENMGDHYLPGWYVPELRDVALVTSGISRWHNFYVEGMRWLTQHAGVDGIYLDDVAFDRTTMQRIWRVLAEHGTPGERIDLHSATQFNKNDGFASSANLYLEHFPYIDRLWFGEYFNYDSPPDYWLIEMSGIPFGLMGEMLEGGGNPWRGMLFGMTNRLPWTGGDPRELWQAWDAFGIDDAKMRGWWLYGDAPVHTGERQVLATSYVRRGRTLVAIASWATDTVAVELDVNWKALGLDPKRVRITAPAIPGFQPARTFAMGEKIPVAPKQGWLIRLDAFDQRTQPR